MVNFISFIAKKTAKSSMHLQKPSSPAIHIIIILFSFLFVLAIFSRSNQIPPPHFLNTATKSSESKWVDYKLSEAASMIAQNNTLIVCTVSEPFLSILNNWLISVSRQNHQNMVLVIAEDYPTLFQVNKKWPGHAVMLSPPLNNSHVAMDFGSREYYSFTSRRPHHLLRILELGYNIMYNDVDMVWLADPLPYMVEGCDVYVTDDKTGVKPLKRQDSHELPKGHIYICGGMMYLRPTNGSKLLIKKWIEEIQAQPWIRGRYINDQPAFNRALKKTVGRVKSYVLPQTAFPSGGLYFKNETWVEENKGKHVIVHNNWIIGLEKKIQRFKSHGLWMVDDHASESPLGIL